MGVPGRLPNRTPAHDAHDAFLTTAPNLRAHARGKLLNAESASYASYASCAGRARRGRQPPFTEMHVIGAGELGAVAQLCAHKAGGRRVNTEGVR